MIRHCTDCDIKTTCEDSIEMCTRCEYLKTNIEEEPCVSCLTDLKGCNFEPVKEEKC